MFRVLELCAGYGSQAMTLKELGLDVYSEIAEFDKYASEAYMQLHGETKNYGDIYTIDETKLPYFDMITYSTPCQDFSVAGNQKGGEKGSGTRSSLLWECERIIRAVKPKYLLMENVKNLMSDKFRHTFNEWFGVLESMGYRNYYKVLNAKDYGVPQNRERIFCVSILGDDQFLFPQPIKLEKRLKDILEPKVDEKYYLNNERIKGLVNSSLKEEMKGNQYKFNPKQGNEIASCLGTQPGKRKTDNFISEPMILASRGRYKESGKTEQRVEVNSTGCSNTLTTVQKDNYVMEPLAYDEQNQYIRKDGCTGTIMTDGSSPKHNTRIIEPLLIKNCTNKGYDEAVDGYSVSLDQPKSKTRRGRVGHGVSNTLTTSCNMGVVQLGNIVHTGNWDNPQRGRIYSSEGCSPALNTCSGGGLEPKILNNYRIRKLTPRECWRLMGVPDAYFDKLHDLSNTQLYKLAGNSIVVDVLKAIFRNLLMPETTHTSGQLNLF